LTILVHSIKKLSRAGFDTEQIHILCALFHRRRPVAIPRKEYSTTLVNHALRTVQCESCQAEYVYVLKCEGVGSGTSVLFLDNEGAKERAAKAAVDMLTEKLENAVDGVPCPNCGWYQADMITHLRSEWCSAMDVAGLIATVFGLVGLAASAVLGYVTWVNAAPNGKGPTLPQIGWAAIISGIVVAAGLVLFFVRSRLAAGVKPNHEPLDRRLALGRRRAALASECTPERMDELLAEAGVDVEPTNH
jgi:hypothetical protein